jgi:Apea-like HEPN
VGLESRFLQLGYTVEGLQLRGEDFSAPEGLLPIETMLIGDYYTRRGIGVDDVLVLPDLFEKLLDRYFALEPKDQERILRWSHWLNHGQQIWNLSPSAAHIAVVQAIEALIPQDDSSPRCETCGRSTGPGATQRFANFLEQYAPGTQQEKGRKQLYDLRSALSHGGKLLSGELAGHAFRDFTPKSWEERSMLGTAQTLARIAGVNWLLRHQHHLSPS